MYDSKKMLELGFAFMNAGEVNFCEGAIKSRSKYQNVAGVVNLAFACELYMKCLLNMDEEKCRDHKLTDLWGEYKKMHGDEAAKIESAVKDRLATNLTFDEMLHNDSNVFYNYRYLYEEERLGEIMDNPLRPQFLRFMAIELYNFLCIKIGLS